jgi:hypothetical protein
MGGPNGKVFDDGPYQNESGGRLTLVLVVKSIRFECATTLSHVPLFPLLLWTQRRLVSA